MAALADPKREAFALLMATGEGPGRAYVAAGYSAKNNNTANASGCRLARDPSVARRIGELKIQYMEKQADLEIDAKLQQVETAYFRTVVTAIDESVRTREGRVYALCERRAMLYMVLAERAQFREHRDVPGGRSGAVVTSYKIVGDEKVKTHEVDLDLMRELREIEKQIAIELGQWTEKREDAHIIKSPREIPDEVLEEMRARGRAELARNQQANQQLPASQQIIDLPETPEIDSTEAEPGENSEILGNELSGGE